MAEHQELADVLGLDVYFCDPQAVAAPSNGNANRLLRQYLPRRTDLPTF